MKEKYFENIRGIGDLWIDQIFYENDCPILFVCSDAANNLYLCVCYDVIESQKWLLMKVTPAELLDMLYNKVTFYDMFKKVNNNTWLIEWDNENKRDIVKTVDSISLPDEILPAAGVYMDRDKGDFLDYIKQLKHRLYINKKDNPVVISSVTLEPSAIAGIYQYNYADDYYNYIEQLNDKHKYYKKIIARSFQLNLTETIKYNYTKAISNNMNQYFLIVYSNTIPEGAGMRRIMR
jgi:hypothetical protein